MRLNRSHPHVPPPPDMMQAASSLSTPKCSLMYSMKWRIKHLEGFISVGIRLWWRENMRDVVYSRFHAALLSSWSHRSTFVASLKTILTKIRQREAPPSLARATDSCFSRVEVRRHLLSMLVFPVYSAKPVLPVIWTLLSLTALLFFFFFPGISIFDMAESEKTPLLLLMSSRPETH